MSIPFYPNTENDLRCAQAVMRMVLAAEGIKQSFDMLDVETMRRDNDWTWNAPIMNAMARYGFEGVLIEQFDYWKLAMSDYEKYLWEYFGDGFREQEMRTILYGQHLNANYMLQNSRISVINSDADRSHLQLLHKLGYYVAPTVNSNRLHGMGGVTSHVVLITAMDEDSITINDPGLPPKENWTMPWSKFLESWNGNIKAWKKL